MNLSDSQGGARSSGCHSGESRNDKLTLIANRGLLFHIPDRDAAHIGPFMRQRRQFEGAASTLHQATCRRGFCGWSICRRYSWRSGLRRRVGCRRRPGFWRSGKHPDIFKSPLLSRKPFISFSTVSLMRWFIRKRWINGRRGGFIHRHLAPSPRRGPGCVPGAC